MTSSSQGRKAMRHVGADEGLAVRAQDDVAGEVLEQELLRVLERGEEAGADEPGGGADERRRATAYGRAGCSSSGARSDRHRALSRSQAAAGRADRRSLISRASACASIVPGIGVTVCVARAVGAVRKDHIGARAVRLFDSRIFALAFATSSDENRAR